MRRLWNAMLCRPGSDPSRIKERGPDGWPAERHSRDRYDQPVRLSMLDLIDDPRFNTPAARVDKSPSEIRRPAPHLGENTREILTGAGYHGGDIAATIEGGIIQAAD